MGAGTTRAGPRAVAAAAGEEVVAAVRTQGRWMWLLLPLKEGEAAIALSWPPSTHPTWPSSISRWPIGLNMLPGCSSLTP